MKTKLDIINETVEYYSTVSNRSVVLNGNTEVIECCYLSENNKKCAVGRCANDTGIAVLHQNEGKTVNSITDTLDSLLKEEYRGHDIYFWKDLQRLHDANYHWDNEGGLSFQGVQQVKTLKQKYK